MPFFTKSRRIVSNPHNAVVILSEKKAARVKVRKTRIKLLTKKFMTATSPPAITLDTIVNVTTTLMQFANEYHMWSGSEKKEIVIGALQTLVREIADENDPAESAVKIWFEMSLLYIIPNVIDTIIDTEKGRLKLQKQFFNFSCCK